MTWRRRITLGFTSAHWWATGATNSLCGLVTSAGTWEATDAARCGKCEERIRRSDAMLAKLVPEVAASLLRPAGSRRPGVPHGDECAEDSMTANPTARREAKALDLWRAEGKPPSGICPHCGSTVSVVQRDERYVARCSHRGCGARGPQHFRLTSAVDAFCRPPAYVLRHMGAHPSSLINIDEAAELARCGACDRPLFDTDEMHELRARLAECERERDEARALLARLLDAEARRG